MSEQTGFHDELRKLQRRFVERCRRDVSSLTPVAGKAEIDAETQSMVVRIAHQLAGAGGTFGFTDISSAASAVEDLFSSDTPADRGESRAALQTLIAALRRADST